MDVNRALRTAVNTGKVFFGAEQTRKAVESGKAQLVVVSSNCPEKVLDELRRMKADVYRFNGTNVELGAACGKPFRILALAIKSPGEADITPLLPKASK